MVTQERVASASPDIKGTLASTTSSPRPTSVSDRPTMTSRPRPEGGSGSASSVQSQAGGTAQSVASSPSPPTPSLQPPSASLTPPKPGGQIVVGGLGRPDSLNPLLTESEAGHALIPLLFDSMLTYDAQSGQLTPHLAQNWTVASDDRTITFILRPDAQWHDGQPIIADDVVFTIDAARDPTLDSLYGPQLEHVIEVYAPDKGTVVVSLDDTHCPSLTVLGELPIMPRHTVTQTTPISFDKTPLGSGPFVFNAWTAEGGVRLTRNEDYWGKIPYLDAWSYQPFETATELQQAVESGRIDVAMLPPGHMPPASDLPPSVVILRYPAPELVFVAFNNDHPILGDARVRLALSMAVDRKHLLDQALTGGGELVTGSLPDAHWAADPGLRPPSYDPEGARQMLLEAGWSDSDGDGWLDRNGERLRLPVRTNGENRLRADVATLIAGYYRAIGIEASVELVLWGAVVDDLFTHDFDIIVFSWPLQAEPDQSRWWLSTENEVGRGYNFVSFADEKVDRLLREAATVPTCDVERRAEAYQQVQDRLVQERPYDFLFIPYAALLTRPDLSGIEAGPFAGPLESAAAWYLEP